MGSCTFNLLYGLATEPQQQILTHAWTYVCIYFYFTGYIYFKNWSYSSGSVWGYFRCGILEKSFN